jgi:peptidoglycan hydrolase CwlO-like protein
MDTTETTKIDRLRSELAAIRVEISDANAGICRLASTLAKIENQIKDLAEDTANRLNLLRG